MRKAITTAAIIIVLMTITGCNSQTIGGPKNLKEMRLNQHFSISSEDEEKYIGKIQFENPTDYDFMPTAVYVQLQIRYTDNGTDISRPNPIQLQAEEVTVNNQKFEYRVEIPKKLFTVFEHTDKENISITIKGLFIEDGRIVLEKAEGDQGRLIKDGYSPI